MDYDRTQFKIPAMFSIEWNSPLDDGEKSKRNKGLDLQHWEIG